MKVSGIKVITTFIFCAMISCNTEKTSTQDTKQNKQKNGSYNKKKNKQQQNTGADAAQVYRNSSDTCTSCCDPLQEIDPKLLIRDKNK